MCSGPVLFPSCSVLTPALLPIFLYEDTAAQHDYELSEGPSKEVVESTLEKPDVSNSNTYSTFGCSGLLSRTIASQGIMEKQSFITAYLYNTFSCI